MKTVVLCTEPVEAHILKGRLEAEGIPVALFNEFHIGIDWTISVALGSVAVQVPVSREEDALEVLSNVYNGKYEEALAKQVGVSEPVVCIRCSSEDTINIKWLSNLSLLFYIFFFNGLSFLLPVVPTSRHIFECKSCKKYWIAHEMRPYYLTSIAFVILLVTALFGLISFLVRNDFFVFKL